MPFLGSHLTGWVLYAGQGGMMIWQEFVSGFVAETWGRTRVRTMTDAPKEINVVWRDCRAKPIKNERI